MPSKMKIQPIDSLSPEDMTRLKPPVKSRFRRLFERQFLKSSAGDKVGALDEPHFNKDSSNGSIEFEPSSVCLGKMVRNFMEESNEKHPSAAVRCGRRCNCFTGNCNCSSEDESDHFGGFGENNSFSFGEAIENLKSMVPCASVSERNLQADTAKIVEKNKIYKRKDDLCRKIVTDGLQALGYDASICKSRWEKSPTHLAGEYEYIDVIISGERLIIDIEFRSEFEIARSTKAYKSLLQILPSIFVGKADRLHKIIYLVSDAAKHSLKKKGMHIPPWRKPEYVKAKWLSPHTRANPIQTDSETRKIEPLAPIASSELGSSQLARVNSGELGESVFTLSSESSMEEESVKVVIKAKSFQTGIKVVTGLASVIDEP